MKFKTAKALFEAIGFVRGAKVPTHSYSWEKKPKQDRAVDTENPNDFYRYCEEVAEDKVRSVKIIYDEVVRLGYTADIVVIEVRLEDGETYHVKFQGEYSSWDETNWFVDPCFAVAKVITDVIWVSEDDIEEEEDSWN